MGNRLEATLPGGFFTSADRFKKLLSKFEEKNGKLKKSCYNVGNEQEKEMHDETVL